MDVFRLSKCSYIEDLSGIGARLYGGRWNSKGYSVLYTAGSQSLAALEALVHIPQKNLPDDFCLGTIHIPDKLKVRKLSQSLLPDNWQTLSIDNSLQAMGNEWLVANKVSVLRVPSVIIPDEWNYLINPNHPEAKKIKVKGSRPFAFDNRLK